jgi:hypothetical protein
MKSINKNASVTRSKMILIKSKPEVVWGVLTNIDNWANWQTDISKPKINGQLIPGTTFIWKTGGVKIYSTIHTAKPYSKFGWTGKSLGTFAIHNWSITEVSGQTQVKCDESMEGFLTWLFKKYFNKSVEKGMQHWLDLLKLECDKKQII